MQNLKKYPVLSLSSVLAGDSWSWALRLQVCCGTTVLIFLAGNPSIYLIRS